jgi:hypothetical protein
VLLIEPAVAMVKMPKGSRLERLNREWQAAVKRWQIEFDSVAEKMLIGVSDPRTREAVINNAVLLMSHSLSARQKANA